MHPEAADFNAVFTCDIAHKGWFAGDADEGFAGIAVLIEATDVAGGERGGEGERDGVLFRST